MVGSFALILSVNWLARGWQDRTLYDKSPENMRALRRAGWAPFTIFALGWLFTLVKHLSFR